MDASPAAIGLFKVTVLFLFISIIAHKYEKESKTVFLIIGIIFGILANLFIWSNWFS